MGVKTTHTTEYCQCACTLYHNTDIFASTLVDFPLTCGLEYLIKQDLLFQEYVMHVWVKNRIQPICFVAHACLLIAAAKAGATAHFRKSLKWEFTSHEKTFEKNECAERKLSK